MVMDSAAFGEIEYDESQVLYFDKGILGFPDTHRFIMLSEEDEPNLFYWLISLDDQDAVFPLLDVHKIMPSYAPMVDEETLSELGEELEIYNIAVIPEEIQQMRVNLKAPIVIDTATNRGMQVIAENEEYGIRHYVFDQVEECIDKEPPC
jgi:flagellar assembly factor FliW